MKLKRPDGALLANLSVFPPRSRRRRRDETRRQGVRAKPVGSGPFVVDEWCAAST
jgi:hypothetical protein